MNHAQEHALELEPQSELFWARVDARAHRLRAHTLGPTRPRLAIKALLGSCGEPSLVAQAGLRRNIIKRRRAAIYHAPIILDGPHYR